LGAYNQIFICTGILVAILAGLPVGSSTHLGTGASGSAAAAVATVGSALGLSGGRGLLAVPWWRCMFALAAAPAFLQTLALRAWAPESPAWLQAQAARSARTASGPSSGVGAAANDGG
jgi:hypothetical protein